MLPFRMRTMLSLVFCICFVKVCNGQNSTDLKNLLQQLFVTKGYNKNVRPSSNFSIPTHVNLDFYLCGINDLDEQNQKLTTTGFLEVVWIDEHLVWDNSTYNGLDSFYISQDDIWKPDLTLKNGLTKITGFGESFIYVEVMNTGKVWWYPFEVFETKCSIDIKYFPFDLQTCEVIFVTWMSGIQNVNVTKGNNGIHLNDMEENGVWRVISTSASEDAYWTQSMVKFKMTMQRSSSYYVMNMIAPVVLLGVLNIFTFVLPANSGEKMSYSVTVFLSFAVFLTIVSSEMPKTSDSILGSYLVFQVAMGAFVVCVTAMELRLHHKKTVVPPTLLKLCRRRQKNSDRVTNFEETKEKLTWEDMVSMIDFVLFWLSLLVVLFGSIATFVGMVKQK